MIAGTGTDVGKTHVTCALLVALRGEDVRVAAIKPVATGVTDGFGEDAWAHARALGVAPRRPRFAFEPAFAPSLAARKVDEAIEVEPIVSKVAELAATHDVVVVETAGGLFTPLSKNAGAIVTNATLTLALSVTKCELVLVAPDRIGVLHDLGACVMAAHAAGLARLHVVLSSPLQTDLSTGTNADELRALGIADPACIFPRAAQDAPESVAAARKLLSVLSRWRGAAT